jgi:hypothetical protein
MGAHPEKTSGVRGQRNRLGGKEVPGIGRQGPRINFSFFDNPPKPIENPEAATPKLDETPIIRGGVDYFKGREIPTDVWAPNGIAYYEKIEDIPVVLFPKTEKPPKIAGWETRAAVALQVCPPIEGESADASFKFVGERGLYVRVILRQTKEIIDGVTKEKPTVRWMHFNEEDAQFKDIKFT